ncbi:hypothetical protein [Xenorhabdus bovienii]|uniref:hypothetical protein n=1 Tax=Xenorhabdus bovienii TaxID=40576 RepID=UPI003DA415AD
MNTKQKNEKNAKVAVAQITRSISFDADCLSSQRKVSKARARYIQDISSKALSIVKV